MRSVILSLLLVALVPSSTAQEQEITFPTTLRCSTPDAVTDLTDQYQELSFAQGKGVLYGNSENQWYPADIKVYLSTGGTFTITAEMDKGIVCLLLVGEDFQPTIPIEKMH